MLTSIVISGAQCGGLIDKLTMDCLNKGGLQLSNKQMVVHVATD